MRWAVHGLEMLIRLLLADACSSWSLVQIFWLLFLPLEPALHVWPFDDINYNFRQNFNPIFNFLLNSSAEFIQPQNLWPYIQQNLIQQNHLTNPAFITSNHHAHHLHPNSNNLAVHVNGINNNNNNGSESNGLSCNNNNSSPEHHAVDSRDNKVIAKPLPSRPFMHHGINHPHLHSLLAHCRNPYMTGKVHSEINLNFSSIVKFQLFACRRWAAGFPIAPRYICVMLCNM